MKHFILAAIMALPIQATAQDANCNQLQPVISALVDRWMERPVAQAEYADGSVLQFWVNAQTGTWTVLALIPGGIACVMAAGDQWNGTIPPGLERISLGIGREG